MFEGLGRAAVHILCTLLVMNLAAEEPQLVPKSEELARLIEQLDSNDFKERETASRALLGIGLPAVKLLKQALKSTRSAEFVVRANRIVRFHEGGGKASNGLKLTLSSNRTEIRPLATLTLTTVLSNMTDKPLKVRVGCTVSGTPQIDFEEGRTVRSLLWVEDWGRKGPRIVELLPRQLWDPFRGSIQVTPPHYVVVPPKGTREFETDLKLCAAKAARDAHAEHLIYYQAGRCMAIDAAPGGTHRLRMCLDWDLKDHVPSGGTLEDLTGDFTVWSGSVFSNEIEINLVE